MDDHRKRKIADGFADELRKMGALNLLASVLPSMPGLVKGLKDMVMGGPQKDTQASLNLGQNTGETSAPTAVPN